MELMRGKMIFAILCGFLLGLLISVEAFHVFAVRNAPIVTGRIVAREPISQYSVPRVDFTIQIQGSDVRVHAHAQRYLMTQVPDVVRFHYNGDPTREVFLFEEEESPYLIVLICWGCALGLSVFVWPEHFRRLFGRKA